MLETLSVPPRSETLPWVFITAADDGDGVLTSSLTYVLVIFFMAMAKIPANINLKGEGFVLVCSLRMQSIMADKSQQQENGLLFTFYHEAGRGELKLNSFSFFISPSLSSSGDTIHTQHGSSLSSTFLEMTSQTLPEEGFQIRSGWQCRLATTASLSACLYTCPQVSIFSEAFLTLTISNHILPLQAGPLLVSLEVFLRILYYSTFQRRCSDFFVSNTHFF